MRWLAIATMLAAVAPMDVDVGCPPGTPLEWNREFRRPLPTGHRGTVPTHSTPAKAVDGASTVTSEKKNPFKGRLEYVVPSLQDFFRVVTVDLPGHLALNAPKFRNRVTQDDVSGGLVMNWNYPPDMPVELFLLASTICLREALHPEVAAWPESAAFCLELGEPARCGAKASNITGFALSSTANYLLNNLRPVTGEMPFAPPSKDPRLAMLNRLAAIEISGGFPHGLDPTFARRTLGLGDESLPAVIDCARSPHPFLSQNAVSVLSNYPDPMAATELKRLWMESRDPVIRIRALAGLVRRSETSILPDMVKEVDKSDDAMKAALFHGLGQLGDPAGAAPVIAFLRKAAAVDHDLFWTAIPALARMRSGKAELLALEKRMANRCGGKDTVESGSAAGPRNPVTEKDGSKIRIWRQMCAMALAMLGDKKFEEEIFRRVKTEGFASFHQTTHYLLAEVLAGSDAGAQILRPIFFTAGGPEPIIKLEGVRALGRHKRLDDQWLVKLARERAVPAVQAHALQLLSDVAPALAKEICAAIVKDYGAETGPLDGAPAFVVAVAAQVGGHLEALPAADLIPAVDRAFRARAHARREGRNDLENGEKISIYPALLESLVIELGRTGAVEGAPVLRQVLGQAEILQGRAEAVLALGAIAGKDIDRVLVETLDDKDGWVRFCAYRSLVRRSKVDQFCDWIFGDDVHRSKPRAAYRTWIDAK